MGISTGISVEASVGMIMAVAGSFIMGVMEIGTSMVDAGAGSIAGFIIELVDESVVGGVSMIGS